MKKVILIAAMFAATAAFATDKNPCGNNGNNCNTGGSTVNQGGAGGNGYGGQGGNGYGVGVGIAAGGNASATGGKASVGDIRNTNTAAGGSVVGSGNSANTIRNDNASSATASGNTTETNVHVEGATYNAARIPVATAYSASIAPTAPCMGSTSGGAQGAGFGFSLGGTWTDENCVLLEQARALNNLGENAVAIEMLNSLPAVEAARKRLADRKAGTKAITTGVVVQSAPALVASGKYVGNDPIVMKRLGLPPLKQ